MKTISKSGCVRLVNPDRGTAWAATFGRLIATSTDLGSTWSIRLMDGGREFWAGRDFCREEIEAWAASLPMSGAELGVRGIVNNAFDQLLGHRPPADNDRPETWRWTNPFAGCLARSKRPSRDDIIALAKVAIRSGEAESLPYLDRFEVWVCDQETELPLALVVTALDLEEAQSIEFSPLWRFGIGVDRPDEIAHFERRLNTRTLEGYGSGNIRAKWAIYERSPDGPDIQHGADGTRIELLPGTLPTGLLGEPWESERIRLMEQYHSLTERHLSRLET